MGRSFYVQDYVQDVRYITSEHMDTRFDRINFALHINGRAVKPCQLTLRVPELQRIITVLFGKVAGVADLFTVIDAANFLAIFRAGHRQQLRWSKSFHVVDAMPPGVVFFDAI